MMRHIAVALLATTAIACSDSSSPSGTRPVKVSFSRSAPSGAAGIASASVQSGADVIVVDSVKLTLEDIDLERTTQSVDCSTGSASQDCSDYFPGPYLVRLNLAGGTTQGPTLNAALGSYDTVSFDISVPDGGDLAQRAYAAAHPEMANVSVRAYGTFNGAAFDFALNLTGDQEVAVKPVLEVTGAPKSFGILLNFDVSNWFRNPSTGALINPNAVCALGQSCVERSIIEANVERTIESYSNR